MLSPSVPTGKEHDPATESGNDYFGARYYSSAVGRFLSPDWNSKAEPVPYAKLNDPQTLGLYVYVRNNPLIGSDLDGHDGFSSGVSTFVNVLVTYVATHPTIAAAAQKVADSFGVKVSLGGVARIKEGNTNVGVAASVTTEVRGDGTGKSAIQGTAAASIAGVGGQGNLNLTFEKNGDFMNPFTNASFTAKVTDSIKVADSVNSAATIGDDGRVALGVGGTYGADLPGGFEVGVTGGVQGTAAAGDVMDFAGAIVGAVISDIEQTVHDIGVLSTCSATCAIPQ